MNNTLLQIMNVLSLEGLKHELRDVIFNGNNDCIRYSSFEMKERVYPPDVIFFRIRRKEELNNLTYNDFWEPPKELIPSGRLNITKEPMLYMSLREINTPLAEVNIKENEKFLLIAYQTNSKIILTEIGFNGGKSDHDKSIKEFLDYFFMNVKDGAYILSNLIAKEYNSSPLAHGWCYPSTKYENGINVCLNVKYKGLLNVIHVSQCSIDAKNNVIHHAVVEIEKDREIQVIYDKSHVKRRVAEFSKYIKNNKPNIESISKDTLDTRVEMRTFYR